MTIKRIVPNIKSLNPEASKDFYEGLLGMKLAMDMGWVLIFTAKKNEQAQITIVESKEGKIDNSAIFITMEISDIDKIYKKAQKSKYEIAYPITDEAWGVRRFFLKDPNGATFNIMSHLS